MVDATRPTVAIGFDVDEDQRKVIDEVLGELAGLVFLRDLESAERVAALQGADVLLSWNPWRELRPEQLFAVGSVRLLQLISAGADHIKFGELPEHLRVATNAGAYADPMAEHVAAMVLALAKRLPQRHAELARGKYLQSERSKALGDAVCAILGFGGIGRAVARALRPFGARIHAINTTGRTGEPVQFVGTLDDLDEVLRAADVLVIALPLTKRTRGLIGKRELGLMRSDAILVNVARASIVEEEALYEHLRSNPDFMAGLDVWWGEPFERSRFATEFPFFELANVLGSPHNSANVPGIMVVATRRAAQNVARFLRGETVGGLVDRADYE